MLKTSPVSVLNQFENQHCQKMFKFIFLKWFWHVHKKTKTCEQRIFLALDFFSSQVIKQTCEQRYLPSIKREIKHIYRKWKHNLTTNHAYGRNFSHAHNVLAKDGVFEHGNCVKLNVHIQIFLVVRENIMFWISQITLWRSLSTHL